MLHTLLKGHKIILSSASPRRQQFFRELGIPYELRLKPVQEIAPDHLKGAEIAEFLAQLKADAQVDGLAKGEILVTADTIVWHRDLMLPKPANREEA
ncbi:MAG: septum formation inhibitor Maf, partial [Flavobacteriaceae bacterium]|nr:septum formation inhibitor Maf [Flavobacteriaceae bacterium]